MNVQDKNIEALEAELSKLKRRQPRHFRTHHARGLLQGIVSMLRPGDLVLDCGANVGDVTAPLASTGADVHAFEPDPFAFERLSERMKGAKNVTLHNAAVAVKPGRLKLMRAANFDDNPMGGSVKSTLISGGRNISEGDGIEVDVISLPDFIDEKLQSYKEVTFLKMDIEGAELELLEHMQAHDLFGQVRLTVAETHENKFAELRDRFKALRKSVTAAHPITRVNLDWI